MIFLIIILIFMFMFVSFFVLFAYLYAYVLFGVLNFSKRLSVRIGFLVFYAIFTLLIAFAMFDIVVSSPYIIAVVILSILIFKKTGYFTNFTKVKLAMAGAYLLVIIWQLEVPQKVIINMFDNKIEIFDNNYIVLKEKDKSNIDIEFDLDIPDLQLFEIYFRKVEIFAYDDINQTKNKRKIGEYKKPFMSESTLSCFISNINSGGKCSTLTNKSKYQLNKGEITLADYLKQYQKGEKQ
ncbi:MAG: hypothetical protein MR964_05865 [Campylobacter sp.]|uniref:hypothetical protein n=1 Tax=Campylobacter sp. TaxID=205 RepID=UPI002AA70951|nr:hypothetical protein [Campylobacter sp.]MCI7023728.1 hypothetical protein [Campylobacter sp.]